MLDLDQVEDILGMVERKTKRDEILNIGAYTFKALKEDYRPKKSLFIIEKEQEAQNRKEREIKEAKEKEIIERLFQEYRSYKQKETDEYIFTLSEKEKADLIKEFEQSLNDFMKRMYLESGIKGPAVEESFIKFVVDNLDNEIMTFPAWAREQGYFLEEGKKGSWQMIDIKKFLLER
jgi:hypothetical protein